LRVFLQTMNSLVESDSLWLSPVERDWTVPASILETLDREKFVRDEVVKTSNQLAARLARCPSARHRRWRFHESFDALATLQFIHRAESDSHCRIPLNQALERACFFRGDPFEPLAWLEDQENTLSPRTGPAV